MAGVKITSYNPAAAGSALFFRALVVLQLASLLGIRNRLRYPISPWIKPRDQEPHPFKTGKDGTPKNFSSY